MHLAECKKGTWIRIMSSPPPEKEWGEWPGWNFDGGMDEFLGKASKILEINGEIVHLEIDDGTWLWVPEWLTELPKEEVAAHVL